MKTYNIYIVLSAMMLTLSACAVTTKPAEIEYHHSNSSLDGSSGGANESTVPIVHNDDELISSNLDLSDTNNPDQNSEINKSKGDDENYIMPASITKNQSKETERENPDDDKKMVEAKPVEIKTEDEPTKQVQQNTDYINPVEGTIITKFGEKTEHGTNKGINISAPIGTPVVAASSGKVIYANFDATFGNLVIIKSDNNNTVLSYAHLKNLSVSKGAHLKRGETIGFVGTTGKIKKAQLHFAVREGKKAVDPLKFVNY